MNKFCIYNDDRDLQFFLSLKVVRRGGKIRPFGLCKGHSKVLTVLRWRVWTRDSCRWGRRNPRFSTRRFHPGRRSWIRGPEGRDPGRRDGYPWLKERPNYSKSIHSSEIVWNVHSEKKRQNGGSIWPLSLPPYFQMLFEPLKLDVRSKAWNSEGLQFPMDDSIKWTVH